MNGFQGVTQRSLQFAVLIGLATGLTGCGGSDAPELGSVSGIVTLDGQALAGATVTFQPQFAAELDDNGVLIEKEGHGSSAVTDSSGAYELLYSADEYGACIATHRVTITTSAPVSDDSDDMTEEKVPDVYNQSSELTANVVAGSNEYNWELDSSAGKIPVPEEELPDADGQSSGDDDDGGDEDDY